MTNTQRRNRISELKDLLSPLEHEKFRAAIRYNSLIGHYRQGAHEYEEEIEELKAQIAELNDESIPLFNEMRSLQNKYEVEYSGEVLERGMLTSVANKKLFYLSTSVDLDSYKDMPDFQDEDVLALIHELSEYIYNQEYSRFTIQHIKKLQSS